MAADCPHCDGSGFVTDEQTRSVRACSCRPDRIARKRANALTTKLPKRYRDVSLESTFMHDQRARAPSAVRALERYLRDIDVNLETGRGLWIYGGVGTGKTELAMLVSKTALERGRSVVRYTLPHLLMVIRDTFDNPDGPSYVDLLDQLCNVDLLHIDDVGAEQTSSWVLEQLYTIVNSRYEEQRAILITTNILEREEMAAQIGERTTSRLVEMCDVLPFEGRDYRVHGDEIDFERRRTA